MLIAIIRNGEIRPLAPLPPEWREGQTLRVESTDDDEMTIDEIDRDFAALASLCESSDHDEEELLEKAILEARRQAKEQVRRQMGLDDD